MKKRYKIWIGITSVMLLGAVIFHGTKPFREEAGLPVMKGIEDGFERTGLENGKYIGELVLPNIDDSLFKDEQMGRQITRITRRRDTLENRDSGLMYIINSRKRLIDGAKVTSIMYLSILREQEENFKGDDTQRCEIVERVRFKVEFNKIIVYKEKEDAFYVKDGDVEITAPYISIEAAEEEDKTVVVSIKPHITKEFESGRSINDEMEMTGTPVKEGAVDFGEYKLKDEWEYAELQVTFNSEDREFDTVVNFYFHDEEYGNHLGNFK